jgi:hypothetical protein
VSQDVHSAIRVEAAKVMLARAEAELALTKRRADKGQATNVELAKAKREQGMAEIAMKAASAEARGDQDELGKLKLAAARMDSDYKKYILETIKEAAKSGLATGQELDSAALDARLAELGVQLAKADQAGDAVEQDLIRVQAAEVTLEHKKKLLARCEAARKQTAATDQEVEQARSEVKLAELQLQDSQASLAETQKRAKHPGTPATQPVAQPPTQHAEGEEPGDETVARVYDLRDLVAKPDENTAAATKPAVTTELAATTQPAQANWGKAEDGLEVSISVEGKVFDADKPMLVRWAIRNVGKEDRAIIWHEKQFSPVRFDITDASGKVYPNRIDETTPDRLPSVAKEVILKPGEVKEATYDLDRFLRTRTGELKLVGVYSPPKEFISEKPVSERAARNQIASAPVALTVYRGRAGGRFEMNKDIPAATEDMKKVAAWIAELDIPAATHPAKAAGGEQPDGMIRRVYDVRDLIVPKYDYVSAGVGWITQADPNAIAKVPAGPPKEQLIEDLQTLVIRIADKASWKQFGGRGMIQILQGDVVALVITQTPENHEKISKLIASLRREGSRQFRVEARFIMASSPEAAKRLEDSLRRNTRLTFQKGQPGLIVSDKDANGFYGEGGGKRDVRVLTAPRITLSDGKRAFIYIRADKQIELPELNGSGKPEKIVFGRGTVFDVEGKISPDSNSVAMTFTASTAECTREATPVEIALATAHATIGVPAGQVFLIKMPLVPNKARGFRRHRDADGKMVTTVVQEPIPAREPGGAVYVLVKPTILNPEDYEVMELLPPVYELTRPKKQPAKVGPATQAATNGPATQPAAKVAGEPNAEKLWCWVAGKRVGKPGVYMFPKGVSLKMLLGEVDYARKNDEQMVVQVIRRGANGTEESIFIDPNDNMVLRDQDILVVRQTRKDEDRASLLVLSKHQLDKEWREEWLVKLENGLPGPSPEVVRETISQLETKIVDLKSRLGLPNEPLSIVLAARTGNSPLTVSVFGKVSRPGNYGWGPRQFTVIQLLAACGYDFAGGTTEVALIRRAERQPEQPTRMSVNVGAILRGVEPDLFLQDKDAVYVHSSNEDASESGTQPTTQPAPNGATAQPAKASPLAGLKIRLVLADNRKEYRIGETIKFNVLAENTGKQAVEFSLTRFPPVAYSNMTEGGLIRLHGGSSFYCGGETPDEKFVIQPGRSELLDTEECILMPPDWRGNTNGRPGVIGVNPQKYSVSYQLSPNYAGQVRAEVLHSEPLVAIDVLPGDPERIRQLTAKYPSGREVAEKFALEFLAAVRKGDAETMNRMIQIHPNFGPKNQGNGVSSAADYAERMKQSQQWWQELARQIRAAYAGHEDMLSRLSETYCMPEDSPRPGAVCVRIDGPAGPRDRSLWVELTCWSDGWRVKNAGLGDSKTSLKQLLIGLMGAGAKPAAGPATKPASPR